MSEHIHPTVELGPDVEIGPGVIIGAHSVIGAGCILEPYAVIGPHTRLGARTHVFSFAVIGGPAQDRRTPPDAETTLVCGQDNLFREGVTISRGTEHGGGVTRIGDGNLFMAHSHVGHDCQIGNQTTIANGVSLGGHVSVDDGAVIGGHAAVHQFVRIGPLAFVAANAMVSLDVPPFCMAAGDRARLVGLNTTGLKRAAFSSEVRAALKSAFHTLFLSEVGTRRANAEAIACSDQQEVSILANFILQSKRGVAGIRRPSDPPLDGPIH